MTCIVTLHETLGREAIGAQSVPISFSSDWGISPRRFDLMSDRMEQEKKGKKRDAFFS
jgi:hypothetical protein